jgi:uncharacterized phage protein (TIGR01671 family)
MKFRVWYYQQEKFDYEVEFKDFAKYSHPMYWACVQQYTGLKDKNGVLICEGDILLSEEDLDKDCMYGDETTYIKHSVVRFGKGMFYCDEDDVIGLVLNSPHHYEVVGNIFENPELLK